MEHRNVGILSVSVVGIGCGNFGRELDQARTTEVVSAAIDHGINFFDTADVYGRQADGKTYSEVYLGEAVKHRRAEVIIGTKFGSRFAEGSDGASPEYVKRACEGSLRRLGTDYLDLYELHHPDPLTPIADTLGALTELIDEGKVREIGASRFTGADLAEAKAAAGDGRSFVSVQSEYSLMLRDDERELIPEIERQGVAFLPFFPLFHGLLTGKYHRGEVPAEGSRLAGGPRPGRPLDILSDRNFDIVEGLEAFAAERGHTLLDLAFAWLLARPATACVLAGATKPSQVAANAAAPEWRLTPDEVAAIDRIAPLSA